MRMGRLLFTVLCLAVYASFASFFMAFGQDGPDKITVVQAVPPTYPLIARNARVSGVVVVEAKLNAGGTVKEVKIIEGHKLLNLAAEKAANKWKFNVVDEKTKSRRVQLRFRFTLIPSNKGTPGDLGAVFWPPFEVEVRDAPYRTK